MNIKTEYQFTMIAGRGRSNARSLAQEAKEIALAYFGEDNEDRLEVELHIDGKPIKQGMQQDVDNMYVSCVARMDVKV